MKQVFALSAVALSVALAACGGGGGDSASTSAPVTTPTPTPAPAPKPTPTPAPQVQLPSLATPDAGSTAAVGNGFEGLWRDSHGTSSSPRLALIAADGTFVAYNGAASTYWSGTATPAGTNWVASPAEQLIINTISTFNDSGTFVSKTSLADNTPGATFGFDTYSPSNALAATASSIVGTWGNGIPAKIIQAQDGTFTGSTVSGGSIGICSYTGTIRPVDPSGSKNMFAVTLTAASAVTCNLVANTTYTGLAAIEIINAGTQTSPVYARTLVAIIRIPGQEYLSLQLARQ